MIFLLISPLWVLTHESISIAMDHQAWVDIKGKEIGHSSCRGHLLWSLCSIYLEMWVCLLDVLNRVLRDFLLNYLLTSGNVVNLVAINTPNGTHANSGLINLWTVQHALWLCSGWKRLLGLGVWLPAGVGPCGVRLLSHGVQGWHGPRNCHGAVRQLLEQLEAGIASFEKETSSIMSWINKL